MRPIATDGIAWSVGRSVSVTIVSPAKQQNVDFGGPKEPCIRWGSRSSHTKGQIWEPKEAGLWHARKCLCGRYTRNDSADGRIDTLRMPTGVYWMGCTLLQPGEYDWTVRVRRRCGLISNYF